MKSIIIVLLLLLCVCAGCELVKVDTPKQPTTTAAATPQLPQPSAVAQPSLTAAQIKAASEIKGTVTTGSTPTEPEVGVTMANYTRLKSGMSYEQVVKILGKEGTELSSSEMVGIKTVMYKWDGEGFGANMNAMFQRNKMMTKAQFGLK